ncbi:MAG: hypothetical protein NT099_00725 [Candidatus Saganbacteria bacterium]|nr:hypothetical protein [Candidatus Saganbacteria bacterium]
MSDDVIKQMKYAHIKSRAGKIAYIMSLGKKAKKPDIEEGVEKARGGLKWVSRVLDEKESL